MSPQVHFILPLKAPSVAGDLWQTTCALAVDSVAALLGQTDSRFTVHLICHTSPDGLPAHASVHLHHARFPAPVPHADLRTRMRDKALKLAQGYGIIRNQMTREGAFIIQMDADDFVHKDLTAHLLSTTPPAGAIFEHGLYYDAHLGRAWEIDRFHILCGTCAAPFFRTEDIPCLDHAVTMDLEQLGQLFWPLSIRHGEWSARAAQAGQPLAPLPFPGAIYRVNTGANNHGPRRVRFRHRYPILYRRFKDQGGTTWTYRGDLTAALAPFNAVPMAQGRPTQ